MPISDQVIELETKKTGRNVVFIILIALLAAASVVFAVLWATKEAATPPPAIDAIKVQSTDMYENAPAEEGASSTYVVVPSQSYTVRFDVVLKENTDLQQVNALLNWETRPAGMIEVTSGGLDPQNPGQYVLNFTVLANAQEKFILAVSSEYSPEVKQEYNMLVSRNGYVEYFDIADGEKGKTLRKVGKTSQLKDSVDTSILFAASDKVPSTETAKYYALSEALPYYEDTKLNPNEHFMLPFSQLGAMDAFGRRLKIMQGVQTETGRFDQVQVFIADSAAADATEADYKEITGNGATKNLNVYLNMGQEYCNGFVRFGARTAGTSTIKLVANAYNGAPQKYELYVQITFASSDSFGEITKIKFYNPYNPDRYAQNDTVTEFDLYLGDYTTANLFPLSDYIQVVCGKQNGADVVVDKPEWGNYALRGIVTDESGNQIRNSILAADDTDNGFAVSPNISAMSGKAYVTIRDNSPTGFSTSVIITVNIRPAIERVTLNKERINMFAGNKDKDGNTELKLSYTLGNTINKDDKNIMRNLNTEFAVSYPAPAVVGQKRTGENEKPDPVYNYSLPVWKEGLTPTNAADTIYIEGMTADKNGTIYYVPKLNEGSLDSEPLRCFVGENVKTGDYKLEFVLAPQGLTGAPNHAVKQPLRLSVTITVTRAATSVNVNENAVFEDCDKHTLVEQTGQNTATLTIAAGTGKSDGNNYYTQFGLQDILAYYYHDQKFEDVGNVIYNTLKITMGHNASMSSVFNDDKHFFVPQMPTSNTYEVHIELSASFTLYLKVEYKQPVEHIIVSEAAQTVYYTWDANNDPVAVSTYFQALSHYGREDSRITQAGHIKYPEKLHADIAVTMADGTVKLLTKKAGAAQYTAEYYWDTSLVFTVTLDPNSMTFAVQLQKDLFALSVAEGKDCQTIRLYYSYGDDVDILHASSFVAYTEYSFVRRFNDVYVYAADKDTAQDPLAKRSAGGETEINDVVSGVAYTLQLAGVMYLDGNSANEYYVWNNEKAFASNDLTATYSVTSGNAKIESLAALGQFRMECDPGVEHSRGKAVFRESENGKLFGRELTLILRASNTATELESITLETSDPLLLYRNRQDSVITLSYTVTYKTHTAAHLGLGQFDFEFADGELSLTGNTEWSFFSIAPKALEVNEAYKAHGLELVGDHYVYKGTVTLKPSAAAENKEYTFTLRGAGVSDSKTVRVTTAIADDSFAFVQKWNNDAEMSLVAAAPDEGQIATLYLKHAASSDPAANTYVFGVRAGGVDLANVTYAAAFVNGVNGAETQVKGAETAFIKDNNDRYVQSFRLLLTGYNIDKQLLRITVTETIGAQTTHYYVYVYIDADVSVETADLRVGDTVLKANETFTVTTTGAQTPQSFDLQAVINNGEQDRLPRNVQSEFALENLTGATADQMYVQGGKLYVSDSLTEASAVLTLTVKKDGVTVKTADITVAVNTNIVTIAFVNADLDGSVAEHNNGIDFTAVVKNAGTGQTVAADIAYDCTASNGVTVEKDGAVFTPHGGNGTFTVTASYGNISVSATVTVRLRAVGLEVKRGDAALENGATVSVIEGQTQNCEFTVTAISAVAGVAPADTSVQEAQYNGDGEVTFAFDGVRNKYVLTPVKAGNVRVTLRATDGGETFVLNVSVLQSALTVRFEGDAGSVYNVFGNADPLFTFHVLLPSGAQADAADITVAAESGAYSENLFTVSRLNGQYALALHKERLAGTDLQKYVITATYTVNGVPCAGTLEFALKASEEYSPALTLSLSQAELGGVDTIDKMRPLDSYTFTLGGVPVGFAETAGVSFSSDQVTLRAAQLSGGTATAQVESLKGETFTSGKVTASVTLWGNTYRKEFAFTVANSAEITGALYYNASTIASGGSLLLADGSLNTSLFTAKPDDIGYADVNNNYVVLIVDYTGIPSAAAATAATFRCTVTGTADVTQTFAGLAHKSGAEHYYFVTQYRVNTAGTLRFDVHTEVLGGKAYAIEKQETSFTATRPDFTLSRSVLTLDPGQSAAVTLTSNAFAGNVTFAVADGYNADIIAVTKTENDRNCTLSVTAATGAGGSTELVLTATVTSGMFAGETYHFTVNVTVRAYTAPTLTVPNEAVWLLGGGESVDIRDLIVATHDTQDTEFAFTVENVRGEFGAGDGTLQDTVFTTSNVKPYKGLNITLYFQVRVSGGFYKDKVALQGDGIFVKIVAAPEVYFAQDKSTLAPDETLDLSLTTYNSGAEVTEATYKVSPAAAGTVSVQNGKHVFTPAQGFAGNVTVTATPEVLYSGYSGAAFPAEKTFAVSALNIDVVVRQPSDDTTVYEGSANVAVDWTFEVRSGAHLIDYSANNVGGTYTVTVTRKADTAGGRVAYALIATAVDAKFGGMQRVFEYSDEIEGAAKPTADANLKVTAQNDTSVLPVTGGKITAEVVGCAGYGIVSTAFDMPYADRAYLNIDQNGNYVFLKKDTNEREVTVTVRVTVSGVPYENVVLEKTVTVYVPAKNANTKPVLEDGEVTVDLTKAGNDNTLYRGKFVLADTVAAKGISVLTYVPHGAGIVMRADGTFDFTAGAGVIDVTVYYTITAGDYAGETVSKKISVNIPALPDASVTVTGTSVRLNVTENFTNAIYTADDPTYLTMQETDNGVWTYGFKKGVGKRSITLTVTATIDRAGHIYHGYPVSTAYTLEADEPELTATFDYATMQVSTDGMKGAPYSATYTSSNTNYVTVDENGLCSFLPAAFNASASVTITATFTVTSGAYAGNEYTATATVRWTSKTQYVFTVTLGYASGTNANRKYNPTIAVENGYTRLNIKAVSNNSNVTVENEDGTKLAAPTGGYYSYTATVTYYGVFRAANGDIILSTDSVSISGRGNNN